MEEIGKKQKFLRSQIYIEKTIQMARLRIHDFIGPHKLMTQ
jgi:hypothetical protein